MEPGGGGGNSQKSTLEHKVYLLVKWSTDEGGEWRGARKVKNYPRGLWMIPMVDGFIPKLIQLWYCIDSSSKKLIILIYIIANKQHFKKLDKTKYEIMPRCQIKSIKQTSLIHFYQI